MLSCHILKMLFLGNILRLSTAKKSRFWKHVVSSFKCWSLVLRIPCEKVFRSQNPLQNYLQRGLEHKGIALLWETKKLHGNFFTGTWSGLLVKNPMISRQTSWAVFVDSLKEKVNSPLWRYWNWSIGILPSWVVNVMYFLFFIFDVSGNLNVILKRGRRWWWKTSQKDAKGMNGKVSSVLDSFRTLTRCHLHVTLLHSSLDKAMGFLAW